jgi:hypothetical protein
MFRTTAGRSKPDLLPARFEPEHQQQQSAADDGSSALLVVSNGHYEPPAPAVDDGIAGCENCRKSFTESGIYSCKRNHNICANCRHCGARIYKIYFYIFSDEYCMLLNFIVRHLVLLRRFHIHCESGSEFSL